MIHTPPLYYEQSIGWGKVIDSCKRAISATTDIVFPPIFSGLSVAIIVRSSFTARACRDWLHAPLTQMPYRMVGYHPTSGSITYHADPVGIRFDFDVPEDRMLFALRWM